VTPYNAQIRAIQSALAASGQAGFRVGTVDKFQGREAPVVIYSMATSSAADAPRGMEFLYDGHRLNVATSRARALAIIVASPDLIRVSCRTPQQMVLANALCRAWETHLPAKVFHSHACAGIARAGLRCINIQAGAHVEPTAPT
jgi:AAA domain